MGECLIVRRGGEAYELPTLNASYPANATVVESATASASFTVQITTPGKPAEYTYQWYVNSAKVTGATGSSYTKAGLTAAGTYSVYCVVTNKAGTVTSRMATLTVESCIPVYSYTGNSQLINDGGYNWRIKFLTSGTLTFSKIYGNCQAFLVGGGGGAKAVDWYSGGGGYGGMSNRAAAPGTVNTGGGGGGGAGSPGASGGSGIVVIRNAR